MGGGYPFGIPGIRFYLLVGLTDRKPEDDHEAVAGRSILFGRDLL